MRHFGGDYTLLLTMVILIESREYTTLRKGNLDMSSIVIISLDDNNLVG